MKKLLLAAGAALIASTAVAAQQGGPGQVGAFTRLDAGGQFELRVVPGDTHSVTYSGASHDFDELEYSYSQGRLRVRQDRNWFGGDDHLDVVVTVTYVALDDVRLGRGVRAEVDGLDAVRLDLEINTGAVVHMAGECGALEADVHTGAELDASDLVCADVELDSATGAIVRVHASEAIDVAASTGAEVHVYGDPDRRRVHTRLGGSVRILSGGMADNR